MRFSLVALALLATVPVAAQDPNAAPSYGTIRLHGPPDPHVVRLRSGGQVDASRLGGDCSGFIAQTPDVRLNHRQSGALPLIISAVSDANTTLVINAPDGSWHCNDDRRAGVLNPSVRFATPQSGRYEIWVGTRAGPQVHPARLEISEIDRP